MLGRKGAADSLPPGGSELRTGAERLHRFADVSAAEGFLEELAGRPAEKGGPLVLKLPRAPVSREQRWAHLLSGPIDVSALPTASDIESFVPSASWQRSRCVSRPPTPSSQG
jgi:uncharacterized protein YceH (UPF0502 family)